MAGYLRGDNYNRMYYNGFFAKAAIVNNRNDRLHSRSFATTERR